MLLYDLPYHPRPEIPDSVSAPDMTIPSDSIEAKPFISHQLEKQDTTQLPADTTTTIPIIEQSDTTIRHTQLPEQVPAFPANDTLVPGQRPIPVISDPTSCRGLIISAVDRYGNSSRTILSRYSGSNENGFDTPGRRIHTKAIRESCRRYHNNNTREVITTRHDRHDRKTGQYRTNRYRKPETTLSTSRYRYNTRSRDNVLIDRFDPNCHRYDSNPTSSPGRIYSNCRDTGRSAESPTP